MGAGPPLRRPASPYACSVSHASTSSKEKEYSWPTAPERILSPSARLMMQKRPLTLSVTRLSKRKPFCSAMRPRRLSCEFDRGMSFRARRRPGLRPARAAGEARGAPNEAFSPRAPAAEYEDVFAARCRISHGSLVSKRLAALRIPGRG